MTISTISKEIDERFRSWFQFDDFNQIQQQCIPSILQSDDNIVISAPTGSGKTTLFELAMLRLFKQNSPKKILYLSPMRALCSEKAQLWSRKFESIGKTSIELIGGDTNVPDSSIETADLIITTPEKWDYVTRSNNIIDSFGLILIDEVHILNDPRGAVLEAIISRMCLAHKHKHNSCRIVAVSATIPNVSNLAQWLRSSADQEAKILKFPDSMRPVPLKTHVISAPMNGKNGFTFDFSLNYKVPDIISKYSAGKPTLIFCSTRKSTIKTAEFLGNTFQTVSMDSIQLDDKHLQELIEKKSLAYHHAGLSSSDREIVEALFRSNKIRVLCSTSTLAIGVNLPAHLVIIKSTLQYTTGSGYTEYSDLDLRQMIGRAGRAGYDTNGIAVILTSTESEHIYCTISEGKLEIDSQLLSSFIEFLSTEAANRNIKNFSDAMEWLSYTFLYVRMKLNPTKYSLKTTVPFIQQLQNSMDLYLRDLAQCGVIEYNNHEITPTLIGQAMARNYIKLKSLKDLQNSDCFSPKMIEIANLLRVISQNSEIHSQIDFKSGDKVLLHKLSNDPRLIFPLSGKSNWESWKKPFAFIQIALQSELVEYDSKLTPIQRSDLQTILDQSCRLLKFIIEVSSQQGNGLLLRNSLELISSLRGRSWHSNSKLLQQVDGIGQINAKNLFNVGIRSLTGLRSCEDSRLEVIFKRNPPFGRNLKKTLKKDFPLVDFDCNLKDNLIKIALKSEKFESLHTPMAHLLVLAYASETCCRILLYDQITVTQFNINRNVNISNCSERSFSCSLMFEDWAGLNNNICFDIEEKPQKAEIKIIPECDNSFDYDIPSDIDVEVFKDSSDAIPVIQDSTNTFNNTNSIKEPAPLSPSSSVRSAPSKCKHVCRDKLQCAHVCCKSGLLKRSSSSTQLEMDHQIKKPTNFLAGTRRSLANAREYLRKYQPIPLNSISIGSLLPSVDPSEPDLYDEIEFSLRSIE